MCLVKETCRLVEQFANDVYLPGGMYDPGDNSVVNTPLREAREEVGINSEDLTFISILIAIILRRTGSWQN